jgi:hypothetical protein
MRKNKKNKMTNKFSPSTTRFQCQSKERQPEIIYQQAPPQQTDTIFNSISPLVWMVIVFIGFILGFFMGMGSGGKGGSQAAPIISDDIRKGYDQCLKI